MLAKFTKAIAALIGGAFVLAYVFLFFPALVHIPLAAALTFEMSVWGGIVCTLSSLTIPLSMPVSIYFIFSTYEKKSYIKMLCSCFLPGCFCIASFLFTDLIMQLHELLER